jgi:F-type H+-transporting ATPase subunit a
VSFLRPLIVLAIVLGAIFVGMKFTAHHEGGIFQTLYMHLMPSPLVHPVEHVAEHDTGHGDTHAAAHPLLTVPMPAFLGAFDMDRSTDGAQLVATNLQVFQVAAVLLIFACFLGVPRHLRTGKGDPTSRLFAGFAQWIRDEMVVPVMGKEVGNKLLPMFLTLFFFIMFMNLLGLVPGGATATASIFVTGALASITFGTMVIGGMVVQGPIAFWRHLVPHVPLALWPLMFAVELVGLVVKPIALMIRLFANMTGGHLAVLSLMGLVFFFGGMSPVVGWASSPVAVGLAVFIMIIESFVALLQAYIFTTLSIIFVQASLHPEH